MSKFAVTIERIGEIREHPNADRLEMASLAGKDYEFVVMKGQFQAGDTVVYFPIDSVLPEWIAEALGLGGKLAGPEKNRIKTVRLRGKISQGVVATREALKTGDAGILDASVGVDVTEALGVEKYDPPAISSQYGTLRPLPQFVSKYDIEGAQGVVEVVETLLDQKVYITEKVEGSHWSVTWYADEDTVVVSQRNFRIEPNDAGEHDWHKVARVENYADKLRAIAQTWASEHGQQPQAVTIRGEMVGPGVQGNYYKLKNHTAYIFEIEIDGTPVDAATFLALADAHNLQTAPVLAADVVLRDWLGDTSLKAASDGRSQIADCRREGIVVKPMQEQRHDSIGRVVLKQRSPEYLSKSEY